MSVFIAGAAAVSPHGFEWRGLGRAKPSGFEMPAIPPSVDAEPRVQKLMSRAARLGAIAIELAIRDAHWNEREEIGCFLGVGASGGSIAELESMLSAGISACNPLFAFQLMNNFALCHGSIRSGIRGPNSAFFSRGTGTVAALAEAIYAIESGDCDRALAGGADSALHPVTIAELSREGRDVVPSEGAGIVALSREERGALAAIERCDFRSDGSSDFVGEFQDVDLLVTMGARAASLASSAGAVDAGAIFGDALAAAPALAWIAALDLLLERNAETAVILSAGVDGGLGAVLLSRRRSP